MALVIHYRDLVCPQKFEKMVQEAINADKKVASCLTKIAQSLGEQVNAAQRLDAVRAETGVALMFQVRCCRFEMCACIGNIMIVV